jgi:hypothetical protein
MENLELLMALSAGLSIAFLVAALWINDRGQAA